jgi:uncharacterized glyoxalase superfamily protein PhnB
MPMIETYRKQAKLLVRWHREGNYSVGGKLRLLDRFREITDREALDRAMPLTLAQEIVAVEAGFADWAALKAAAGGPARSEPAAAPVLAGAVPILFVRDVAVAAAFYAETLGFAIDFLHGKPAFYGSVSRDAACLHLRHVGRPNFTELAAREGSLILATIAVGNVKALFEEYRAAGAEIAQGLVKQAWGGTDFHVRDPDGNVIAFVQYR